MILTREKTKTGSITWNAKINSALYFVNLPSTVAPFPQKVTIRSFLFSSESWLIFAETPLYDQLLQKCFADDLTGVTSTLEEFECDQSLPLPLHALAVMTARKGRVELLDLLLQKGADFNEEIAAAVAVNSVEMLKFLWYRNWRNIQHSKNQQAQMVRSSMYKPVDMLEFLLHKGAKFSPDVFDWHDCGKTTLPAMKILVAGCGVDSLRRRAIFTLAVEEGNRQVVKYLCKLGVPINDVPPEFDIREPYASTSPLWAAVNKRDMSMVGLLLEHGADPNAPFNRRYLTSVLTYVREKQSDNAELLALLEKYASPRSLNSEI